MENKSELKHADTKVMLNTFPKVILNTLPVKDKQRPRNSEERSHSGPVPIKFTSRGSFQPLEEA